MKVYEKQRARDPFSRKYQLCHWENNSVLKRNHPPTLSAFALDQWGLGYLAPRPARVLEILNWKRYRQNIAFNYTILRFRYELTGTIKQFQKRKSLWCTAVHHRAVTSVLIDGSYPARTDEHDKYCETSELIEIIPFVGRSCCYSNP